MPRLYLFRITNIQSRDVRRVAILSKDNKPELDSIVTGEVTGYFDKFKFKNDNVDYKAQIDISDPKYEAIIDKLSSSENPVTKVINEGGKYIFVVDKEELLLINLTGRYSNFIEYPIVYII